MSESDDERFMREADAELTELMAEASQRERRHGLKPRTFAQDRALLEARRDALRLDLEEIAADLDDLDEKEAEAERSEPTGTDPAATERAGPAPYP